MSKEIREYNEYWEDIDQADWPKPGTLFICKDPQIRDKWLVSVMGDGTLEGENVSLGLFWKKHVARFFANEIIKARKKGRLIQP